MILVIFVKMSVCVCVKEREGGRVRDRKKWWWGWWWWGGGGGRGGGCLKLWRWFRFRLQKRMTIKWRGYNSRKHCWMSMKADDDCDDKSNGGESRIRPNQPSCPIHYQHLCACADPSLHPSTHTGRSIHTLGAQIDIHVYLHTMNLLKIDNIPHPWSHMITEAEVGCRGSRGV